MKQAGKPSVGTVMDAIATLFMQAYVAARARALSHPSPVVRLLAQRNHAILSRCCW